LVLLVWMNFTNNGGKSFLINVVELDFVGEQLKPVESISEHLIVSRNAVGCPSH